MTREEAWQALLDGKVVVVAQNATHMVNRFRVHGGALQSWPTHMTRWEPCDDVSAFTVGDGLLYLTPTEWDRMETEHLRYRSQELGRLDKARRTLTSPLQIPSPDPEQDKLLTAIQEMIQSEFAKRGL